MGLTESTQRALLHHLPHHLLRLPIEKHLGSNRPWSHAVSGDSRPFQLLCHYLHHRFHCRLGRCISPETLPQRPYLRRRQADNPPTAAPLQPIRCFLAAEEGPPRVHPESFVEILDGSVEEGWVLGIEYAGGVDEDVGLGIEGGFGGFEEGLHLGWIGDVGLDGDGSAAATGTTIAVDLGGNEFGLG